VDIFAIDRPVQVRPITSPEMTAAGLPVRLGGRPVQRQRRRHRHVVRDLVAASAVLHRLAAWPAGSWRQHAGWIGVLLLFIGVGCRKYASGVISIEMRLSAVAAGRSPC
jgi:hypothetical protein